MKKTNSNMPKIFLILLSIFLASCAPTLESPVIYFSNASLQPVRDIQCYWNKKNYLSLPELNPGDSRSESFYMHGPAEFFGPVLISWRNDKGEKIIREFFFRENNLPSIVDHTTYNYVQFYLDQEEMELVSSDAPDLAGKTRKMERLMAQLRQAYIDNTGSLPLTPTQSALIRVQHIDPQKDKSVPYWENSNSL